MLKYVECSFADIPDGVRFFVPPAFQGQSEEVAWGDFGMTEARPGAPYKRETDRSVGPHEVTYFKRVPC